MKITVTTERDCCASEDLLRYRGQGTDLFCKHCGQAWIRTSRMDPAGGTEPTLEKARCLPLERPPCS